jgi:protein OS-9
MMSWLIHRLLTLTRQSSLPDTANSPKFEVVFSDSPIAEPQALSLIDSAHPTYDAELSSQTDLAGQIRESTTSPDTTSKDPSILSSTYELISLPPHTYLCSIPVLAPPSAPNQTATDLAKAEEARELARASVAGWEIMNTLDGHCLYFMSGWWSYSFCYNKEIVQFHALPNGLKSGAPPVRDPQSAEYVLGRVHYDTHQSRPQQQQHGTDGGIKELPAPPNSELAAKDNQRYLVQRLDGGTLCDLTGRDRTIEVQYHCHPGIPGDRIGWIKEVTTCTYLMVVQTPRLCADVAFLPPKEGRAHPITCQPVGDGKKDGEAWFGLAGKDVGEGIASAAEQAAEVILSAAGANKHAKPAAGGNKAAGMTIGGVLVGGRKMLGTGADGAPAARLPPPRHLAGVKQGGGGAGAIVEILAKGHSKADGGKVEVLAREELEKLELSPEAIEELRKELQKLAGDNGWKLEVVEVPGEAAEIRGIVEGDDEDDAEEGAGAGKRDGRKDNDRVFRAESKKKKVKNNNKGGGRDRGRAGGKDGDGDGDEEDGSEEVFYRDEL